LVIIGETSASLPHDKGSNLIKLRTGQHRDFIRIVFEGNRDLISKGSVEIKGKKILIDFGNKSFELTRVKTPVLIKREGGKISISLKKRRKIRSFRLNKPERLVIDIFTRDLVRKNKIVPEKKKMTKNKKEKKKGKKVSDNTENKKGSGKREIHIPDKYKKLWALFKSGNAYGVLAALPEYPPEGKEEVAMYHYLYGVSYMVAQEYLDAIEHLTLAYIFAEDKVLKEESLISRARAYRQVGFLQEARADYTIFIKKFPDSVHIKDAHMELANTLSDIGLFEEAVVHYDKAGEGVELLYSKANALQKIGRYRKAREIYKRAISIDSSYPVKSPETEYLIGENLRMIGELIKAKNWLSTIQIGPYKDRARLSLGLIAMKEGNYKSAINYFQMASMSKERTVKVRALLNLSLAYIGSGKINDAIDTLEKIRHRYIDSGYYRDAILVLAKLYRKQGDINRAVKLLKELVYAKYPPEDAFSELEKIILIGLKGTREDIDFADLWRQVGQWMIDQSREELLLKVARRLRQEDRQFIDLCKWLIENASTPVKKKAATELADYYIEIGDEEDAKRYIAYAVGAEVLEDETLRVMAKIMRSEKEWQKAIKTMKKIKKFNEEDLRLLGNILYDMMEAQAKGLQEGISLYKKVLKEGDWGADAYARIADILYGLSRGKEASQYIKIAYQKNPSDEWLIYRMARIRHGTTDDLYARLQGGNTVIAKVAKTKIFELRLMKKMEEVF